jgi:hypothetical protein
MAERGTPDQNSSQAPFIQALVQKSVTAITNPVGRLSFRMLRESWRGAQGGIAKKLALRLLQKTSPPESPGNLLLKSQAILGDSMTLG